MAASLVHEFALTDGTTLRWTAPIDDANVVRFVTWGLSDTVGVPNELDADGNTIPRTVSWLLRRLTEMYLSETFAKVAAWEHAQALAAVQQPTTIPVTIS